MDARLVAWEDITALAGSVAEEEASTYRRKEQRRMRSRVGGADAIR